MNQKGNAKEGQALPCSSLLVDIYRLVGRETFQSRLRRWILRMEGGPLYSLTIREILRRFHRVDVGLYSSWPYSQKPAVFHPGTAIGRYSWIAETVRTFTRNHPTNTKSSHGFFENPELGMAKQDFMQFGSLWIGNGVSIGHNAIILPPTESIGDGAIINPGSVVYSNVPPYAIVTGFPARVIGFRFNQQTVARLLASRWWNKSLSELAETDYLRRLIDAADPESREDASDTGHHSALKSRVPGVSAHGK